MRGPKPYKVHDPDKIKAALARGIVHGNTLYTIGCRCEVCRKARRLSATKYRSDLYVAYGE